MGTRRGAGKSGRQADERWRHSNINTSTKVYLGAARCGFSGRSRASWKLGAVWPLPRRFTPGRWLVLVECGRVNPASGGEHTSGRVSCQSEWADGMQKKPAARMQFELHFGSGRRPDETGSDCGGGGGRRRPAGLRAVGTAVARQPRLRPTAAAGNGCSLPGVEPSAEFRTRDAAPRKAEKEGIKLKQEKLQKQKINKNKTVEW